MSKKILILLICIVTCLQIGCSSAKVGERDDLPFEVSITEYQGDKFGYFVLVDDNTGVCYLCYGWSTAARAITPLLNRDGSPVLIEEGYKNG